ncbi:MAG: DUF6172 family protein [Pirellulaceae bacterium]|nr:DUF6172 family protein [Pirellulaceae bacterium]
MKRTYQLTKGKHAPARVIESIKSNINKYVKRERRKELPDDIDFWDFECKVGAAADAATTVHLSAIGKAIDVAAAASKTETIYVEIETHGKKRKSSQSKSNTNKTPVVEAHVSETPVVETPVVETPAVETPAVETPVVETPAVETPAVETPVGETPVVETPVGETPVVETPAVESKPSVDVSPSPEVVSNSNSPASDGVDGSVH